MSQEKNEKLGFSKKSSGVVLKDVTKIFQQPDTGKDFVAVDHINLEIKDGEMVTLLGPSGCGKTTTLRMISGFEYPTSGNVFIGDRDVAKIPPNKRGISMVFQSYALFPHLNIWENIAYGLRVAKIPQDEIIRRTNDVVELMQLKGMEKRFPNQLSGGQQQRVALARAVVIEPSVLLFDEPLSNLDAKLRNQMRAELIKLRHEIKGTFIYVTHDQTEAMTLGDRIVVMKDGVVQQIATPQEVFNHPANIFVAGFIGVPQMNFFDAQLVRSGNGFTVKTEDMNVALAPETCAQLALNWDGGDVKEIAAGVRPEQILLADKDEEGALQGTVEVTELMGSTEHVHVTAPDGQFVLIIPVVDLEAKGALKAGDTIWFKFEKNATHLFDKVSGKNLI